MLIVVQNELKRSKVRVKSNLTGRPKGRGDLSIDRETMCHEESTTMLHIATAVLAS